MGKSVPCFFYLWIRGSFDNNSGITFLFLLIKGCSLRSGKLQHTILWGTCKNYLRL